jgi:hypothetical protein
MVQKGFLHGPNIYKDIKLTSKGTWRQVFICLRHPISSPPPVTHCMNTYPMYFFTLGKRGGGVGKPVKRLEGR